VTGGTAGRRHTLHSPHGSFLAAVDETGARIASLVHAESGTELLFRVDGRDVETPVAPGASDSNREWHERYAGGWHTLVPNAGDHRTIDGVDHPFHGEAAWRRWTTTTVQSDAVTLELALRTVPLRVSRTTTVTEQGLRVRQRVRNTAAQPVAFTWTEHPAFSSAVVDPATRVLLGDEQLTVMFPEPGHRHGAFRSLPVGGRGSAVIAAPAWTVTLRWDPVLLPHLHVWQEHRQTQTFPWWGRADTVALEPASRPYAETGDLLGPIVLPAGEEIETAFLLDITPSPTKENP
jgi:hypothetical protein